MSETRSRLAAVVALIMLGSAALAGPAAAQIPGGMNPEAIREAISRPISVPPGETVSVDLGVPVQANYSGGGWNVYSTGSTVTVTAPAREGESVTVPVTAMGQNAAVTLSTTDDGTGVSVDGDGGVTGIGPSPAQPGEQDTGNGGAAPGGQRPDDPASEEARPAPDRDRGGEAAPGTPPRDPASTVSTQDAEFVDLAAEIDGNVLTAKMSLGQAMSLYRQFSDLEEDDVTVRYVDVNHQIIEDVEREIDPGALSMTLTYPEGQTPDNPFIIEVVRGDEAVLIVRLTAPETEAAEPTEAADVPEEFTRAAAADSGADGIGTVSILVGVIGAVLAVSVVALLFRAWRRRQA